LPDLDPTLRSQLILFGSRDPMRVIHLACAVLFAACAGTRPSFAQTEAERVVQAYHDAFNRRDLAGVVAAFAPDAVLLAEPADTVARGVDQIRRIHKDQFQLAGVRVEVRAHTAEGQGVVQELVYHGIPCNKGYSERVVYVVQAGRIRTVTITPLSELAGAQVVNAGSPLCFPPDEPGTAP
jgi:hypothetical protein